VPLEIDWSALAISRLQELYNYVALDKPLAADRLAVRIVAAVESLRDHPYIGRPGKGGTRELVIGKTPYIVVYRVERDMVRIGTIWHGAQNREP